MTREETTEMPQKLAIHERRTLHGDGEVSVARTVVCPDRGEETALDDCEGCEHFFHAVGAVVAGASPHLDCECAPRGTGAAALWTRVTRNIVAESAARLSVAHAMSPVVVCVTPEVTVEALSALFLDRGISGAPVVDASGRPIGVVSKTDLVRESWENPGGPAGEIGQRRVRGLTEDEVSHMHAARMGERTVADVMTPMAQTLLETAPLANGIALMLAEGIHRVPVVSRDGRVVGILSAFDVLRWLGGSLPAEPAPRA